MTPKEFTLIIILSIAGIALLLTIIFGLTRWIFKIDEMEALQQKHTAQLDEIIILLQNKK